MRYERMAASPFAFYRGAAAVMAADLAMTPVTGLTVQACGDAHVANFGDLRHPRAQRDLRRERLRRDATPARGSGTSSASPPASMWSRGSTASRAEDRDQVVTTAVRVYREYIAPVRGHEDPRRLVRPHHRRRPDRALPEAVPRPGAARPHPRPAQGPPPGGHPAHRRHRRPCPASSRTPRSSCTSRRPATTWTRSPRWSTTTAPHSPTTVASCSTASGWSTSPAGWSGSAASAPAAGCASSRPTGHGADDRIVLQVKEAQPSVLAPYVGASRARSRGPPGRRRPAAHPGGERHLPRLERGARQRSPVLRAPAVGREGPGRPDPDGIGQARALRRTLRPGARPGPRPHRATPPRWPATSGSGAVFDEAVARFAATYAANNLP